MSQQATADLGRADAGALLEVCDLHADYGREVLHGVGLSVEAGRCLVVIGESGSGKSTLLRALLGVGVNVRGSVRLGGHEFLKAAGVSDDADARLRPDTGTARAGRLDTGAGTTTRAGHDMRAGRSGRRAVSRVARWTKPARSGQEWRRARGARIGMVFQDPVASFSPVQSVGTQVLMVARTHRCECAAALRRQALWLMSEVGLAESAWHAYPGELSGGMAARMALVCALMPGPDLLLMDEPTAGVDAGTREAVTDLVRRACAGTLTGPAAGASAWAEPDGSQESGGFHRVGAVIVTHDLDLVTAVADDVLVLHAGRVVEYGPAAQVLAAPRHEHTALLLEAFAQMRDSEDGAPADAAWPAERVHQMGQADRVGQADRFRGDDASGQDEESGVVLEVRDLSKDWGEGAVLEDVNLTVRAGEAVALTGPSGVGKTTLARIVAGLATADGGSVRRPQEPGGVGLVFQSPAGQFNPRRRLWTSVAEGLTAGTVAAGGAWAGPAFSATGGREELRSRRERTGLRRRNQVGLSRRERREAVRAAVAQVFVRCRLDPALMDVYPRRASLGQLQRAAIARAVLSGARLLICDEVTSALDPLAARDVLDLLAQLRDSGLAIVFITHDRAAADYLCDREISLARERTGFIQ